MHRFVADSPTRARPSRLVGGSGRHGKPSIVTRQHPTACLPPHATLLRGALESGEADASVWNRASSRHALPGADDPPLSVSVADGVARALAEGRATCAGSRTTTTRSTTACATPWRPLSSPAAVASEVLTPRLDCLGRYGGLPMLWHDQTKVATTTGPAHPERSTNLLQGASTRRSRCSRPGTTGRPPRRTGPEWHCSRRISATVTDARRCLQLVPQGLQPWIDEPASAAGFLPGPAQLGHQPAGGRRELDPRPPLPRSVSERMAEHYIHLPSPTWRTPQHVGSPAPARQPGDLLTGPATPLTREQAQALAIDPVPAQHPSRGRLLHLPARRRRRRLPLELDCHNCDKFVLSRRSPHWRANASSGDCWPKAPRTTPPPTTSTAFRAHRPRHRRPGEGPRRPRPPRRRPSPWTYAKPQDYFHRCVVHRLRTADLADRCPGTTSTSTQAQTDTPNGGDRMNTPPSPNRAPPRPGGPAAARPRRHSSASARRSVHLGATRPRSASRRRRRANVSRSFLYDNPEPEQPSPQPSAETGTAAPGPSTTATANTKQLAGTAPTPRTLSRRARRDHSPSASASVSSLARSATCKPSGPRRHPTRHHREHTLKQRVRQLTADNPHSTSGSRRPADLRLQDRRVADLEACIG